MAKKKTVAIVDDDVDILNSVKQILEKNGYNVCPFDNGRDFFRNLNEGNEPALIILDIMMPLMSGWEIHRRLGENPEWRDIPIVFLTSRINDTAEEMYKRYGVKRIKKPFDIKDLIKSIDNIVCNRKKHQKEMKESYQNT